MARPPEPDVYVPLDVEHFLSFLVGRSAHGMVGWHRPREWRQYCRRLIRELERYIRANVVPDHAHAEQIEIALNVLRDAVDAAGREASLVAALARLCLLLIGDLPKHWRRAAVNRPEYFMLDRHRTVHYSQSPAQKADLIYDSYIRPRLDRANRLHRNDRIARQLETAYWNARHPGRHAAFVERFKRRYPGIYRRLFG